MPEYGRLLTGEKRGTAICPHFCGACGFSIIGIVTQLLRSRGTDELVNGLTEKMGSIFFCQQIALDPVIVGTKRNRPFDIADVIAGGEDNHRDVGGGAVTLEASQDLKPIQRRQINVEEDEAGRVGMSLPPPFHPIGCNRHAEAGPLKQQLQL